MEEGRGSSGELGEGMIPADKATSVSDAVCVVRLFSDCGSVAMSINVSRSEPMEARIPSGLVGSVK